MGQKKKKSNSRDMSMKVKIIPEKRKLAGEFYTGDILDDKVYDVLSIEKGCYRILDESGEDYLCFPEMFQIVEE